MAVSDPTALPALCRRFVRALDRNDFDTADRLWRLIRYWAEVRRLAADPKACPTGLGGAL